MTSRHLARTARRLIAAAAAPLLAACWSDMVTDQTIGSPAAPSAGPQFASYVAIGTSLGAGIQSGGINDSTQRQSYPFLLARSMGLVPGVTWHYPSFNNPGCPPPLTNVLTGARVTPPGFPTSTAASCYVRSASSVSPVVNNVSIPGLRIQQALDLTVVPFGPTDTLRLAQFITGGIAPMDLAERAQPTFVTLEVFANDALGAATRADTTLLTDSATFHQAFTTIANRLDATGALVATMNLPTAPLLPHFSAAFLLYCFKNGCAPLGIAARAPYNVVRFTVDASCNHSALDPTAVGDSTLVLFRTAAVITSVLAAGGLADLNCVAGTATTTPAQPPALAVVTKPAVIAIFRRLRTFNAVIAAEAGARGWALANWDAALRREAAFGRIPAFPNLASPTTIFGPIFSFDGIHPNARGHRIIVDAFRAAILARFGLNLPAP